MRRHIMRKQSKNAKLVFLLAVLFFFAAVGLVGVQAQSSAPPHGGATPGAAVESGTPKKAEQQFKNIQVLKGIPAEQLIPTMEFIRASLGVGCEYCHEHDAFDKDDKEPKKKARKMMEMMITINQENFNGQRVVTCNSCHNGNPKPQSIPSVMPETPKELAAGNTMMLPPVGGAASGEAKGNSEMAQQLLDKYVQASGGAAAIEKVSSRIMKGTINFGGKSLPIEIFAKDPDQRISFTHMPEGDSVTAFNGHEGWLAAPGRPGVRPMQGSEVDAASMDADLHLPIHLKAMFSELQAQGTEKIGDAKAYVVVGMREGKTPMRLFFDEQSGLLIRLVRFGDTALGWLPTEIDYADYRENDGVKVPYRWTLARPGGRFTIQVSETKQNVPVDDAKFAKPVAEEPPKAPVKN